MSAKFENAVADATEGHLLHLGAGHVVAIYTRDGDFWVAEFKDGRSELSKAATFFRFHAGTLRYSNRCHAALTPEMLTRIERLHQQLEALDARLPRGGAAIVTSAMRWCHGLALTIRAGVARIAGRLA